MTPPREPWARIGALIQAWRVRLSGGFATAASGVITRSEPCLKPEVADSSDLLKRRMRGLHLDPDDLARDPARMAGITTGLCARNHVLTEFLRYSDVRMRDFIAGLQYADECDWIIAPPNVLRLTEEGMRSYMRLP